MRDAGLSAPWSVLNPVSRFPSSLIHPPLLAPGAARAGRRRGRRAALGPRADALSVRPRGTLIDARGAAVEYEYTGELLVERRDRAGHAVFFGYDGRDASARCVRTWASGGGDRAIAYVPERFRAIVTDTRGRSRTVATNAIGQHPGGLGRRELSVRRRRALRRAPRPRRPALRRWCATTRASSRARRSRAARRGSSSAMPADTSSAPTTCAVWTYERDAAGRLLRARDPSRQRAGRRVVGRDPAGHRRGLDPQNRVRLRRRAEPRAAAHRGAASRCASCATRSGFPSRSARRTGRTSRCAGRRPPRRGPRPRRAPRRAGVRSRGEPDRVPRGRPRSRAFATARSASCSSATTRASAWPSRTTSRGRAARSATQRRPRGALRARTLKRRVVEEHAGDGAVFKYKYEGASERVRKVALAGRRAGRYEYDPGRAHRAGQALGRRARTLRVRPVRAHGDGSARPR